MHNNIVGQVHYLQEYLLHQIIPASSIAHEEEVVQPNLLEEIITDNLIVHE